MKFFLALIFAVTLHAQSDCGNCYIAGTSCQVVIDCGDAAFQVCEIVHCDYEPCSYVSCGCQYGCPNSAVGTLKTCNLPHKNSITTKSVIASFNRVNSLNLFSYFATVSSVLHIPISWFLPNYM